VLLIIIILPPPPPYQPKETKIEQNKIDAKLVQIAVQKRRRRGGGGSNQPTNQERQTHKYFGKPLTTMILLCWY
jgi:hypothetical protein